MSRLPFSKLISIAALWMCVGFVGTQWIFAQTVNEGEESDNQPAQVADGDLPELPPNAIWQFGTYGRSADSNGFYRLAFSPDGKLLAARDSSLVVTVYNTETRERLCSIQAEERINCLNFSQDSRYFLTTAKGATEKVKVWNARTGKKEAEFGNDVTQAIFSKSGKEIFALAPRQLEVYSWPKCELIRSQLWSDDSGRRQVISDDGSMVVLSKVVGRRENVSVFNFESKSQIFLNGPGETPKSIVISPNGLWLAVSGYRNPKIQLWDLRGDPDDQTYFLPRHKRTVHSMAFTPDNRFLISTSFDKKVVVWDLLTKLPVGEFEGHADNVNSSACSPLDFTVATGSSGLKDCRVIVWDLKKKIFPDGTGDEDVIDFEDAWKKMGSNFPKKSLIATRAVFEAGSDWIGGLRKKLSDQLEIESLQNVDRWIQQLDDPKFSVREEAFDSLSKSLVQARPSLLDAQEQVISAEVQIRIARLLKLQTARPIIDFDQLRRLHRSILALEMIGSEDAESLLQDIAERHADIDVAQDAKNSLRRIRVRRER